MDPYLEKCRKYTSLGGSAQIISKLHRGGYRNLLQYYNVCGGSLWTANLNYVIHGRSHKENLDDLLNFVPETTKRHIKNPRIFRNGWIRCYHPLSTKGTGIDVFLFRNRKRTMLSFLNSVKGFHFEDGAGRWVSNRQSFFISM